MPASTDPPPEAVAAAAGASASMPLIHTSTGAEQHQHQHQHQQQRRQYEATATASTLARSPSSASCLLDPSQQSAHHTHHHRRQSSAATHDTTTSHDGRCQRPYRAVRRWWRRAARFFEDQRRFFTGEPPVSPYYEEEEEGGSYEEIDGDEEEPASLRHGGGGHGAQRGNSGGGGMIMRSTTISVDYLKRQDRRPLHLAGTFFLIYVIAGVWYFMWFKALNFRDATFQIINSLSAVGYGDFDPSTPIEQALTIVFLFVGVGFMGSLIGIVASSRLDFQDDVKKEWLRMQEEAAAGEGEEPGVSLMGAQLKLARQRIFWNIARMLGAIALGTLVLVPVEKWTWGYGVFFSSQMIMGSGWVDVMPETEFGVWFALFYALAGSILIYHALGDLASIPLTLRQSRFEAEVLAQWGDFLTEDKLDSLSRRAHEITAPPSPPRNPRHNTNNPPTPTAAAAASSSLQQQQQAAGQPSYASATSSPTHMNHNVSFAPLPGTATPPPMMATVGRTGSAGSAASASSYSSVDAAATTTPNNGSNGNGKKATVTREEFVISMMLLLGRVDMVHVREAQRVFDHLDKDKTGVLNEADVAKDVEKTYTGVKYRRAYTRQRHGQSSPARPLKAKASVSANAAAGGGGKGVGVGFGGGVGEESKDAGSKR